MRNHARWIFLGFCVIAGIQLLISLGFTGFAYLEARSETAASEGVASIVVFGLTLGGFFIGGFAIGRMSEEARLVDGAAAGLLTVLLSAAVYALLPGGNKGQFVIGNWLTDANGQVALGGRAVVFGSLALLASVGGTYLGWRLTEPLQSEETSISPDRHTHEDTHKTTKAAAGGR